jgi:hypothetical protein
MKTLREYINLIEGKIDDSWFKDGGFNTFKLAKPIHYDTATDSGTVDTLEGPVRYEAGHKIITGPKGEKYPVSPESFEDKYDIDDEHTATPKKIVKYAKLADHDGVLQTSWGNLEYTKGNDVIVRHGDGDYGAVKLDIFQQTYNTKEM